MVLFNYVAKHVFCVHQYLVSLLVLIRNMLKILLAFRFLNDMKFSLVSCFLPAYIQFHHSLQ